MCNLHRSRQQFEAISTSISTNPWPVLVVYDDISVILDRTLFRETRRCYPTRADARGSKFVQEHGNEVLGRIRFGQQIKNMSAVKFLNGRRQIGPATPTRVTSPVVSVNVVFENDANIVLNRAGSRQARRED